MAVKQQTVMVEKNNWFRWGMGIAATFILALLLDIGHYGSSMKKTQTIDHQRIDNFHEDLNEFKGYTKDQFEQVNKKQDYIIQKLDKLYEQR